MKKTILSLIMVAISLTMMAQYRDVTLPEKPNTPSYKDYDAESTPFWFSLEAEGASSIMESKTNMQAANLTLTGGYRLSEYLRLGIGFGGRIYVNNYDIRKSNSKFAVPLFVNARGNFISAYDRDGVPFWSVNTGGFINDGFFLNPTIGYSFGGLRNNFMIGLSYTLSTFKNCVGDNEAYSYFGIKLGYEF